MIQKYETPNEILKEFVDVRLEMYKKRRETMLAALNEKLPYHSNVVRFIKQQCEETPVPDLRRKTSEECDRLLEQQQFMKLKDSYDYLMNLPISSLTLKHMKKHEQDLEELKQKIADLEGKTEKDLWLSDLERLN